MTLNYGQDTICAVSTPSGKGGIAVVRVSGPTAISTVDRIWRGKTLADVASHTAHLGSLIDGDDQLDRCVATVYRAPASFTGDDVVELSVHGSPYIQRRLLQLLVENGCRIANPGEFTQRAFLAGKLDLAQAEAVADVIAASTRGAHRLASRQLKGSVSERINMLRDRLIELAALLELELDFSEEDVEFASRTHLIELCNEVDTLLARLADSFAIGRATIDGLQVVIAGPPNAGKSTLLNLLLEEDKAIVSDIPGTTRDIIEDSTEIEGILFRFVDTAGLRNRTDDTIERKGMELALSRLKKAAIILYLIDTSAAHPAETFIDSLQSVLDAATDTDTTIIPVFNKTDMADDKTLESAMSDWQRFISSVTTTARIAEPLTHSSHNDTDLEKIRAALVSHSAPYLATAEGDDPVLTNVRHYHAITRAREELAHTIEALTTGLTPDLTAQHLRSAIAGLSEITGTISTPDLLTTIFSRFCIGK